MNADENIQKILMETYKRKLENKTRCQCGNPKSHLYKMCCRCNNRNKKMIKNGLKTNS